MNECMNIQAKVAILRQHETYCYQICFYLIQDERLSVKAAGEALLELVDDPNFFIETVEKQKMKVKQVTMRSLLKAKATA